MIFKQYFEIKEFKNKVMPFLEMNEDVNNLGIGILNNLCNNLNSYGKTLPFTAVVKNENNIELVLLMTPPYNLQIIGKNSEDAVATSINGLITNKVDIPGIIGRKELCRSFEKAWMEIKGCNSEIEMDQRIYRYDGVESVQVADGYFKIADETNSEILLNWLVEFNEYIGENSDRERVERSIKNLINKKKAYLWIDKVPVAMVLAARETKSSITVSGVFTPEKFRRKGYATSCVAQASKLLLDEGYKYCTLYTDLSNPTSNSIYQKIGYKPIADSIMIKFKDNN